MQRGWLAAIGLASAVLASCASAPEEGAEPLVYGCDDVVVVGRIDTDLDSYRSVEAPGDLIGHGDFDAMIDIKRVLYGDMPERSVGVVYNAHSSIRDDETFVFVLSASGDGYAIRSAAILRYLPRRPIEPACRPDAE